MFIWEQLFLVVVSTSSKNSSIFPVKVPVVGSFIFPHVYTILYKILI